MTKLFGDSVLILVQPFVWLWVSILWAVVGGFFSKCNFQTLPTITLPYVVVSLVAEKWGLVVFSTAEEVYPIIMPTNGCQFHRCWRTRK